MRAVRARAIAVVAIVVVAGCAPVDPSLAPSAPSAPSAIPSTRPSPSAALASPSPSASPRSSVPTVAQLIGQKLVIRIGGTTASPAVLQRIQRGEVGGVILFGPNIATPAALRALTGALQAAAAKGRQPPLLIAVDQEGGEITRIPWAPPTLTPAEMGRDGRPSIAHDQGLATATALRDLGINVDFAPVADVPTGPASFMEAAGRTFSMSSATVSDLADAFAAGLEAGGVLPSMKHFPGIGPATRNTDDAVVVIDASAEELDAGLLPYQTAIGERIPLVMLSNATYPAYDADDAAGWSHAIGTTLLRDEMGFAGVTITDSLDGTAKARALASADLAERAARAGTDLLLLTGSEATSSGIYQRLVREATAGDIDQATLLASYDRILALKAGLSPA
jgi:beta-N-acetylhexosaminidase